MHYYSRISKIDLMRVTHPQNNDAESILQGHFEAFFQGNFGEEIEITEEKIRNSDVRQLVELSILARRQELEDKELWFKIEEGLGRGKKLYLLNSEELVKLKWAFDNKVKQGTPIFH